MNEDNNKAPFGTPPPVPGEVASSPVPNPAPPMPGGIAPVGASDEYTASFSVHEDDFKEMPAGDYSARLIKVESKKSGAGNPMYAWTYVILDGEFVGEEMMNFTALTPAAMWKLKETLIGLGIKPVNGVYNFKPVDHTTDPQGVINKQVVLVVEIQEYKNQMRASIDKVLPFGT